MDNQRIYKITLRGEGKFPTNEEMADLIVDAQIYRLEAEDEESLRFNSFEHEQILKGLDLRISYWEGPMDELYDAVWKLRTKIRNYPKTFTVEAEDGRGVFID